MALLELRRCARRPAAREIGDPRIERAAFEMRQRVRHGDAAMLRATVPAADRQRLEQILHRQSGRTG